MRLCASMPQLITQWYKNQHVSIDSILIETQVIYAARAPPLPYTVSKIVKGRKRQWPEIIIFT